MQAARCAGNGSCLAGMVERVKLSHLALFCRNIQWHCNMLTQGSAILLFSVPIINGIAMCRLRPCRHRLTFFLIVPALLPTLCITDQICHSSGHLEMVFAAQQYAAYHCVLAGGCAAVTDDPDVLVQSGASQPAVHRGDQQPAPH